LARGLSGGGPIESAFDCPNDDGKGFRVVALSVTKRGSGAPTISAARAVKESS